MGRFTIELVYARFAPGVLRDVMDRTPRLPSGELKYRLQRWSGFMQRFNVASPQFREDTNQLQLDLEQKTLQRKMDL